MEKLRKRTLRVEEIKKKQKKRKRLFLGIGLILILITLAGVYYLYQKNKEYTAFQVIQSTDLTSVKTSSFKKYKDGVIKYNRDGVEAIDDNGSALWNVSYNVKTASVDVKGDFVTVGDIGGKNVYIINGAGRVNSLEMINPIVEVEVASQGVTAVLTGEGDKDYINIYGMDSIDSTDYLFSMMTYANTDGFPVDIDISQDGKKLVTSYMAVEADAIVSKVTFFNLGEVGKNMLDYIAGNFSDYKGEVIPKVEFLTNEVAVALRDSGFTLYSMKEVPVELLKETYLEKISTVFYNETYIGVVLEGTNETKNRKLLVYEMNGKRVLEKEITFSYDKITLVGEQIVFYNGDTCTIMDSKGNIKLSTDFLTNVNELFGSSKVDEYLFVTDIGIDKIKLIDTKEE